MPPESSSAGGNSTPEFPAGLDWLNTDGPLHCGVDISPNIVGGSLEYDAYQMTVTLRGA